MSSNYLGGGLLVLYKLPELLFPEGFIDALKALEDVARSMTAWIQFVVPPIDGVHERPNQTMDVPLSSDTFTNCVPDVTPAESSSRVLFLPGHSMSKKALKDDVKARKSQAPSPTELEGLLFRIPILIEEYLRQALKAEGDDEAMRYIMAARVLFMIIKPLMNLEVSVRALKNEGQYSNERLALCR